jgi:hypothetical protein
MTPVTGDGISASTLSVEISNSGSSRSTLSPTFFSQRTMVPSAIDSPIWGITTSVAIKSLGSQIRNQQPALATRVVRATCRNISARGELVEPRAKSACAERLSAAPDHYMCIAAPCTA